MNIDSIFINYRGQVIYKPLTRYYYITSDMDAKGVVKHFI